MVTILLMMVFLDREWVNYTLQLTEQTADFAAEAGGNTHEAWATINVTYRWYWYEDVEVCDEPQADGSCKPDMMHKEPRLFSHVWSEDVGPAKETDLQDHWTELAGCRRAAPQELVLKPEKECVAVEVDKERREVRFTPETEPVARQTFMDNWEDRSSARLVHLYVWYDSQHRSVMVTPVLAIKSLFGLAWERTVPIRCESVTQLDDLVLK
jgi:uncharacterized protein YcfL